MACKPVSKDPVSEVEARLSRSRTVKEVLDLFEAELSDMGFRYFDIVSLAVGGSAPPSERTRFYHCNYVDGNPWRYMPNDWPQGDLTVDEASRRTVPFDLTELVMTAPSTPMMVLLKALAKLWNIRFAWCVPLNAPGYFQCVTVYALHGDAASFAASRHRVHLLSAAAMDRILELHRMADGARAQTSLPALSEQEAACLSALQRGLSNAEIAAEMGISANTVRYHLKRLFKKLEVRNRTEAVARAAADQGPQKP